MAKRLVIHALFTYTDPATKNRRTAFRGETINVGKEDQARGEKFGAFGTEADLAPAGLDEGVVDLQAQDPTGTPVVPHVSKAAILEGALRQRLGVEPGASEAQVLAALDQALTKAPAQADAAAGDTGAAPQEETTAPELRPAGQTIVALPPMPGDDVLGQPAGQGEPAEPAEVEEGQAAAAEPQQPPLTATTERWRAYAVEMGMPAGEAAAMKKPDLVKKYTG